jgi:predicted esterase
MHVERFTTRRTARCAVRGPADPAAVRELWIVLHGYGQLARDFIGGLAAADDGHRLIVAPEALSRFYSARAPLAHATSAADPVGDPAAEPVGASWMTRDDRDDEIVDQLGWLDQVLATYRARVAPGTPVTVLGFSQGAATAARWVDAGGVAPAHLILWGAIPAASLSPDSAVWQTRCTIVVGSRDRFISEAMLRDERARLDQSGVSYTCVSFVGGHRLDDATLAHLLTPG